MNLSDYPEIVSEVSDNSDGNLSFKWGERNEVIKNRKGFLEKHSLHLEDCVVMAVEHADRITIVNRDSTSSNPTTTTTAESVITNTKDITLFLLTADCLPISIFDPVNNVIALAHLGWKPTGLKLIQKVLRTMKDDFNSEPANILVNIGPCIHKESYQLEVVEQKESPEWRPYIEELISGEVTVDLIAYNKDQMTALGVPDENIKVDPIDTVTSDSHFSHYRSVRTGEPEGRFATVLALK